MSKVVGGFGELIWKIEGYNSLEKILERRIPLNDATEERISIMLKDLASKHLTAADKSLSTPPPGNSEILP